MFHFVVNGPTWNNIVVEGPFKEQTESSRLTLLEIKFID